MSNPVSEILRRLCAAPGTSGWEDDAGAVVIDELRAHAPEADVRRDALGNVIAFLGDKNAPCQILMDAHLDQIGLVVTHITDDGFLRFAPIGGMDRRVLPCASVTVYGREPLPGTIAFLPPHLTDNSDTYPEFADLAIDIGMTKEESQSLISLGDRVCVNGPFQQLLGTRVTGAALDDRAGCAALLLCAEALSGKPLSCGVTFTFTSREETGCEGAKTAAYAVRPTEALIIDVTFGDQPGVPAEKTGKLGAGPMIGIAPSLNRAMKDHLFQIAKDQQLPYQIEVMGGSTGTNADNIGLSRNGIPTAMLSIPLRYMHTPAEVIDTNDVATVAAFLTAYGMGGGLFG
ncbi:MAG: M20/M25/M40 family metallo-hydrolase [Oscillospiraceae bacterium]|nr:M20/M25/M40 family metallo-hydrolase [Oscillospiraceae bacterium]